MQENIKGTIRDILASIENSLQYVDKPEVGQTYKNKISSDLKMIDQLLDYKN